MKVTKAIIPAAGLGTRFLPQTKAMPKEMLPIIDKPVIQIVVEELVEVGVTDIIIVTGAQKRAIEDHFDLSVELEQELLQKGKTKEAEQVRRVGELANFIYLRQKGEPKGNARPVLNAQHLLNNEPFFVLFPDEFCRTAPGNSRAKQLLDVFETTGKSVVSLIEIDSKDTDKYGVAAVEEDMGGGVLKLSQLVEKPGPEQAPSNYGAVAGYLLTPDILPIIAQEKTGVGGEMILADSIKELAQSSGVYGKLIEGVYHDSGNKLSYLNAVVDMALEDPVLGAEFRKFLDDKLKS